MQSMMEVVGVTIVDWEVEDTDEVDDNYYNIVKGWFAPSSEWDIIAELLLEFTLIGKITCYLIVVF